MIPRGFSLALLTGMEIVPPKAMPDALRAHRSLLAPFHLAKVRHPQGHRRSRRCHRHSDREANAQVVRERDAEVAQALRVVDPSHDRFLTCDAAALAAATP